MTDKIVHPASEITYYKETDCSNPMKRECITLSVKSQTNKGALELFRKLKEEVK